MTHQKQLRLRNLVTLGLLAGLTLGLVIQWQRLAQLQQTLRDVERQIARLESTRAENAESANGFAPAAQPPQMEKRLQVIEGEQAAESQAPPRVPSQAPSIIRMQESAVTGYLRFPIEVERAMMGEAHFHSRTKPASPLGNNIPVSPTPHTFAPLQQPDNHQP